MVRAEHACPGLERDPAGIPRRCPLCFQSEASASAFPGRTHLWGATSCQHGSEKATDGVGSADSCLPAPIIQRGPEGSFYPHPSIWKKVCYVSWGQAMVLGDSMCISICRTGLGAGAGRNLSGALLQGSISAVSRAFASDCCQRDEGKGSPDLSPAWPFTGNPLPLYFPRSSTTGCWCFTRPRW